MERRVRAARHAGGDRDEAQRARSTRRCARREVTERFEQLNIETRQNTPEEFRAFVEDQMERWGRW